MADYRFDRSAFKIASFDEADATNIFAKDIPYEERLRQAYYLISVAYAFPISDPPKMDKTCFSMRKIND